VGVAFLPDGKTMITAGEDRTLKWWDSPRQVRSLDLGSPVETPGLVAFAPNGGRLAWTTPTSSSDSPDPVVVYSLSRRAIVQTLKGHLNPVRAMALSPDGRLALTAGGKKGEPAEVLVWSLFSGRYIQALPGHKGVCEAVAISPDGKRLATAAEDGVRLFELERGKEAWKEVWRQPRRCSGLAFSGELLAGVGERLWTWRLSGEEAGEVEVPEGMVRLALDAKGETVAVARPDEGVVYLVALQAETVARLDVGLKEVTHLTFSPDGETLAVAGPGHTVKLWGVAIPQERAALGRHGACFAAFLDDGQTLLTVSPRTNRAYLWHSARR
jgi:WD40 repeat protein